MASFLDPDDHNLLSSRANSLSEFLDLVVAKPGEAPVDVGGLNLLLFEPKFVTEDVPTSSTSTSDTPGPLSSSPERKAVAFEAAQMSNSGTGTAIRARPLSSDGPRIGAVVCCVPGDQDGGHNHQTISFGGLSNAIDGSDRDGLGLTDPWTKVIRGRGMLENILTSYPDDEMLKVGIDDLEKMELRLVEDLMRLLGYVFIALTPKACSSYSSFRTQSPNGIKARKDFRENIFVPPIELQTYATTLSAANMNKKWYGTRLSTVILVRRATGEVLFVERDRLRANSAIVQSKSTRGDGDSGVGLNVMLSTPDILTADEGRAAQRLFRFTFGE